jgi:hypothetical protein
MLNNIVRANQTSFGEVRLASGSPKLKRPGIIAGTIALKHKYYVKQNFAAALMRTAKAAATTPKAGILPWCRCPMTVEGMRAPIKAVGSRRRPCSIQRIALGALTLRIASIKISGRLVGVLIVANCDLLDQTKVDIVPDDV